MMPVLTPCAGLGNACHVDPERAGHFPSGLAARRHDFTRQHSRMARPTCRHDATSSGARLGHSPSFGGRAVSEDGGIMKIVELDGMSTAFLSGVERDRARGVRKGIRFVFTKARASEAVLSLQAARLVACGGVDAGAPRLPFSAGAAAGRRCAGARRAGSAGASPSSGRCAPDGCARSRCARPGPGPPRPATCRWRGRMRSGPPCR